MMHRSPQQQQQLQQLQQQQQQHRQQHHQQQQPQQQLRSRRLKTSLCVLCISCCSLTTKSFHIAPYEYHHHHHHPIIKKSSFTISKYPVPVPFRLQLQFQSNSQSQSISKSKSQSQSQLHAKSRSTSLPESSSSRNERNNEGKPKQPLSLSLSRRLRKELTTTELKATGLVAAKSKASRRSGRGSVNGGNGSSGSNGSNGSGNTGRRLTSIEMKKMQKSSSSSSPSSSPKNPNQNPNPNEFMSHRRRAQRLSGRTGAGAWYQRDEMMQHEILTREEEVVLGRKIIKAKNLRDEMTSLIEKRRLEAMEMDKGGDLDLNWEINSNGNGDGRGDGYSTSVNGIGVDVDIIMDVRNHDGIGMDMGMNLDIGTGTGTSISIEQLESDFESEYYDRNESNDKSQSTNIDDMKKNEEMDLIDLDSMILSYRDTTMKNYIKPDARKSSTLVQDGSKLSAASYGGDISLLSEDDVKHLLKIDGGKIKLRRILIDGAKARNTLMRSNIRLVVSVGKKWMGRSKDNGGIADRYNGSWDRPSLDEVIQEGMLGLARAVDKYDPDRGLRFSTYSTHWITSYVRQCFQTAATGCLKVPSQLHDIKSSYKSIIKRHVEASEGIPTEEQIASEIGVSLTRLRTAIRVTESLISIDEPVYSGGNAAFKGSGAGGDLSGDNSLLISDRLECSEIAPEDFVETSFLRQTLENAMAAELSPYERDILRLRLGLDDGQTRTVKQVVEECGGDISVSEVRSAERRAFKKLRSPNAVHAHNLVAYLEMADIDIDESFEQNW